MSREDQQYLDLYYCLPNEFLIAYPQPQLFKCSLQNTKKTHRNNNALERTVSLKLSNYRPKNLLHPYRVSNNDRKNDTHSFEQRRTRTKESFMNDGDMSNEHYSTNISNKEPVIDRMSTDIGRPVSNTLKNLRLFQNSTSNISSFSVSPSTFNLNRTATWRKLQANITPSRYQYIQQFQRDRQHHLSLSIPRPVMLSPSTHVDQKVSDDQDNSNSITTSTSSDETIHPLEISLKENTIPSSDLSVQDIEEFQPISELMPEAIVPSLFLSDILTSIFPTISIESSNDLLHFHPMNNTTELAEYLIIDQPKPARSLSGSIEELCLLIRKLLQCELNEEKPAPVQILLTNQLATLLTYLAISNNDKITDEIRTRETMERMTLTDENEFSPPQRQHHLATIGTQTDHAAELEVYVPPQKVSSLTELLSTSVTLRLPGHRLYRALSDTFIYQIRHQQQYSSSHHRLVSLSETTMHSLMHRRFSTKTDAEHLLQRIKQRFQHYVELESSNTCLEASTEFTPDFLLTTVNNTKHDHDNDDDQTEQFGVDTDKQEKNDTLTFNSSEQDNYDSLELDLGRDSKHSVLFNQSNSETLDDHLLCSVVKKLSDSKRLYQWQVPVLPRRSNSTDLIYERRKGKIDLKHLKVRSNSNSGVNLIGKRVRIPVAKRCSTQELSEQLPCLNFNNNCNEQLNSIQSVNSIDSLCSLESDTLDNHPSIIVSSSFSVNNNIDRKVSFNLADEHIIPSSLSTERSSHLSDITERFDSNIALAEGLLNMLSSLNDNTNNLSREKTDLLHMYIREFLLEFDAKICRDRNKRKNARRTD